MAVCEISWQQQLLDKTFRFRLAVSLYFSRICTPGEDFKRVPDYVPIIAAIAGHTHATRGRWWKTVQVVPIKVGGDKREKKERGETPKRDNGVCWKVLTRKINKHWHHHQYWMETWCFCVESRQTDREFRKITKIMQIVAQETKRNMATAGRKGTTKQTV